MITPINLTDTRIQLHYAIQGIAATGMALAEYQPDDSQMTCQWSSDLHAFVGHKLPGVHPVYVAMEPVSLTSLIVDEYQRAIASIPLVGHTLDDILDWHRAELTRLGFDVAGITWLSYPDDFPDDPVAHGAPFQDVAKTQRQTLADYFAHSRLPLKGVVMAQAGASPLQIWPHHFDMATLITLSKAGATPRTIGVGLSPGDRSYDQPYWYATPWPYPANDTLPPLSRGHWHTNGWIGAVLPAEAIDNPALSTSQQAICTFLDEAVEACHIVLEATVNR